MSEFDDIKEQIRFTSKQHEKIVGSYLFQAVWIETNLDEIISYYFTVDPRKKFLFMAFVLKEVQFSQKIRIFLEILNEFPKTKNKHKSLKKRLDNVRDFRNKLVHDRLDTSVKFLKEKKKLYTINIFKRREISIL